jgi:hypothetical protein
MPPPRRAAFIRVVDGNEDQKDGDDRLRR